MTRLIDANALKLSHCKECTMYPDKCMGKDCDWHAIIHINEMPTIDAIPISFIEEQVKLCNQIGFIRGEECYIALIENWREKNGTETD